MNEGHESIDAPIIMMHPQHFFSSIITIVEGFFS